MRVSGIIALPLIGCRLLSAQGWRGPPIIAAAETGETAETGLPPEPKSGSLESLAVAGWLGPNAASRFGITAAYLGREHIAVLAPQASDRPGQIYLFDVPSNPDLGEMGSLEDSRATITGSPQFCPGINGGTNLALAQSDGALSFIALGCSLLPRGGLYLLPAEELSGAISMASIGGAVTWTGMLTNQRLGNVVSAGNMLENTGDELVVGAPGGLGPGSVYILPLDLAPGDYRVDEQSGSITEITGNNIGDAFGEGLAVGVDASGAPAVAVTAPGAGALYVITGPFAPGELRTTSDLLPAFSAGAQTLRSFVSMSDLDGDGTQDVVTGSEQRWYGLLSAVDGTLASSDLSGSCDGAQWCIEATTAKAYVTAGLFDREDGADIAISDVTVDTPGQVSLFFGAGALAGPLASADADLILEGASEGTGSALLPVARNDYDWLLVGEYGLDLAGATDIGALFLVDLQLVLSL